MEMQDPQEQQQFLEQYLNPNNFQTSQQFQEDFQIYNSNSSGNSQQQSLKKKKKIKAYRYKTELCKNYEELGYCNYSNKCEFAHGRHELQKKNNNEDPRYKTQECYMYFKEGICPYGRRCIFKHDDRSVIQIKESFLYQKELIQGVLECTNRIQSRIFNEWSGPSSLESSENGDEENWENMKNQQAMIQQQFIMQQQQYQGQQESQILDQLPNFDNLQLSD